MIENMRWNEFIEKERELREEFRLRSEFCRIFIFSELCVYV